MPRLPVFLEFSGPLCSRDVCPATPCTIPGSLGDLCWHRRAEPHFPMPCGRSAYWTSLPERLVATPTSSSYTNLHLGVASAVCPPAGSKAVRPTSDVTTSGGLPNSSLFIRTHRTGTGCDLSPGDLVHSGHLASQGPARCLDTARTHLLLVG